MADYLRSSASKELVLSTLYRCLLVKWKVAANQKVSKGSILAVYKKINPNFPRDSDLIVLPKLKSDMGGLVKRLLVTEGEEVLPGDCGSSGFCPQCACPAFSSAGCHSDYSRPFCPTIEKQAVILLDVCEHKTIMKDMCAECGADLRREPGIPGNLKEPVSASVALVHNIPELRVSQEEAEVLAKKDKESLLKSEKLVLVVDLDQTLIHTTTENVPVGMKDIYHFQLHGQNCWFHTKFRPGWKAFLEDLRKHYELHIFTMGSRMYAHTIARMLDPTGELFADRIRSRDESFDMFSKYRDLRALFPCDDSMVCIIDDREDIWDCAPNLITVKPYRFFAGTGDINAPPGSDQAFTHPSAIPLHERPAVAELKNEVHDGSDETTNEKPATIDMEEDKQAEKSVSPKRDSSTDTVAIQSVSKNSGQAETSTESQRMAVSEINHNLDQQGITRKRESGKACGPVNGSCVESPDATTKRDFEGSSSAAKRETCDECEIDSTVSGTEALKGKYGNYESDEMQKKNKIRNEIVEPINEENITTDEIAVNLGESSGFRKAVDANDGVIGKAVRVSEYGGQEESGLTGNIVNDKHNEEASVAESEYNNDDDDYLLYLKEILHRIHQRFYEILSRCRNTAARDAHAGFCAENPPDLRSIVPELRRSVLKGTNVVFTGVIPTNCRHEESQAWKIATQFGAGVTRDVMKKRNTADKSRRTTHVIAARLGTEKACQASRLPNVKLVNPNWLWTCAERWEWVDERLFPVEDTERQNTPRNETPPLTRKGTPKRSLENEGIPGTYTPSSSCIERPGNFEQFDGTSSRDGFREARNPLLRLSSREVEAMDKEVEDLMRSSEEEDGEFIGSVSSSSGSTANGRNSSASDESLRMKTDAVVQEDMDLIIKGKSVNFSTIKQATTSKRRELDFSSDVKTPAKKARTDGNDDGGANADSQRGNEGSTGTSSGEDDDDNDMAAMLEAALYHT